MITGIYNSPSFGSAPKMKVNLPYILENGKSIVPKNVLKEVRKAVKAGSNESLKEVHQRIYAPLLECKTVQEAMALFSEFRGIVKLPAMKKTPNLTKIFENMSEDNFVLKILTDVWAKLKTLPEIAEELGVTDRHVIMRLMDKAHIPGKPTEYHTLLEASTLEGHNRMAAKTAAWNAEHPNLRRAMNQKAGLGQQRPECRAAASKRVKEFLDDHPEILAERSEYLKAVWRKCPEIREEIRKVFSSNVALIKIVHKKETLRKPLTPRESLRLKSAYRDFWKENPDLLEKFRKAHEEVKAEMRIAKNSKKGNLQDL